METTNAWKKYTSEDLEKLQSFTEGYRKFISDNKTERECAASAIKLAEAAGYVKLSNAIAAGKTLKAGDKVYADIRGKSVIFVQIGTKSLEEGLNILGAHIDSPRLDIKQNPLEERNELATFDTHYYGGVKKYQWVTIPLAIHGVLALKDGSVVNVCVGEDPTDPVFCISDLLIHLSAEQLGKTASKVIEGEMLDLIIGNRPLVWGQNGEKPADAEGDEPKEAVKANVINILKDLYGIEEADLLSAELEIVPAGPARDMGFDRSMVLAYGQDDRVCAYTSLVAMLEVDKVKRTTCCLLVDKEEIGSVGATGMQSRFFENAVAEILTLMGKPNSVTVRRTLENSRMLSSDVSAGYDPLYASAFEKKNASYLGMGVVFNKFTGSRGKSGSNDANAEYMGFIRRVMESNNVTYQTAELGKVDLGGGGTIAYIMALYGMNVIDCGVAVLSMHAPWEVTSKADIYEAKRCYVAFLNADDETI